MAWIPTLTRIGMVLGICVSSGMAQQRTFLDNPHRSARNEGWTRRKRMEEARRGKARKVDPA